MKTLLLIRHAKSSWNSGALNDFDRPLNNRGKNDAPVMARRLIKSKINIDAFISSPAKRAKKTAELFMNEFRKKNDQVILIPELYEASVTDFYETLVQINDKYKNVAIFSHNPGITEFANELTENVSLDDMPTCSIFGVKMDLLTWSDFKQAPKDFWFFDFPKKAED